MAEGPGISIEVLAHDLAMAYINNRYGPEVSGRFDITAGHDGVATATVWTERLPHAYSKVSEKVVTGEKRLFGLMDKKVVVETDAFQVDAYFNSMIDEYHAAHRRFVYLLSMRRSPPPPPPPPPPYT